MLDYLGSIEKPTEEIDRELIQSFRNYNSEYIQSIILKLRNENMIQNNYSISGWMVFHKSQIINHIREYIQNDTVIVQKKLLLLRYFYENEIPTDMIQNI